jgi:hypothetical protein
MHQSEQQDFELQNASLDKSDDSIAKTLRHTNPIPLPLNRNRILLQFQQDN